MSEKKKLLQNITSKLAAKKEKAESLEIMVRGTREQPKVYEIFSMRPN